jgi:serine/threonine-protein phosphatase PP1 catalytic subunit
MTEQRNILLSTLQRLLQAQSRKPGTLVKLNQQTLVMICELAKSVIFNEPFLLELTPPIKIVGDIHGQFFDLLRIFQMLGYPSDAKFLFLGDYIDRGTQGIETMTLLLTYKILYPEHIYLLRGNHECAEVNGVLGFKAECSDRYSPRLWNIFNEVFNCMPMAASIGKKIFATHAGISPEIADLRFFDKIERPIDQVPDILIDLLWSDPDFGISGWEPNPKGRSYCFGLDEAHHFLDRINHEVLVRSHQMITDGFQFPFEPDRSVVSIFSAPDTGSDGEAIAGVMVVSETLECSFPILRPMDRRSRPSKNSLSPIDEIIMMRDSASFSRLMTRRKYARKPKFTGSRSLNSATPAHERDAESPLGVSSGV